MGEKNLFSEVLYAYNKSMFITGQVIKVASPSSENPLAEKWLLQVLSCSCRKKHPWADLLSWVQEDRGCWPKIEWNLLFTFGYEHMWWLELTAISWLISGTRWWAFSPEEWMELPSPRLSGQLRKPGRASSAAPDSHPKSLSTKDLLCSSQSEKSSKALIKISVFRQMPGYVVDEVSNSKVLQLSQKNVMEMKTQSVKKLIMLS